ncbi:hypothetical protein XI09_16205 [Bradyrhizobium sp. CCBAU 11386]|uniref:hypothetical protein n=1 Tax=Bradyrhizobium sp. CCBAU 11386 TaxID=1630837 RepID=UPI002302882F|nr:hypothetical protein [Bradyrhizobium sp. CCBAU 11386]MDA9506147.1 hypothetical protein [Bradyrhizobium sp. CCBAU 11386]
MRNTIIIVATILVFIGLCFGSALQDRIRRKADVGPFDIRIVWRAFGTIELYLYALLLLILFAVIGGLLFLDRLGLLSQ